MLSWIRKEGLCMNRIRFMHSPFGLRNYALTSDVQRKPTSSRSVLHAMCNALYTASFLSASEHFLQTLRPLKSATSSALPQKMHVHVGSYFLSTMRSSSV